MLNFFKNKRVLIVGASGFIGSKIVNKLKDFDCTIIRATRNLDKLQTINDFNAEIIDLELNYSAYEWDNLIIDIDIILYLSAQTSIYVAENDVQQDFIDNVKPIIDIISCCTKLNKVPIFGFASSATVYGLTTAIDTTKEQIENPITIYDVHKLLIEKYLKLYTSKGVLKSYILRLCNVYGISSDSSAQDRGIVNKMAKRAVDEEDLTLYGDGGFIRDYIHIDDVVNAFLMATINIDKTNGKQYTIGSGKGKKVSDVFKLISFKTSKLFGKKTNIKYIPFPDNVSDIETRNFVANSEKFTQDTSWVQTISIERGIEDLLKFYNKQMEKI